MPYSFNESENVRDYLLDVNDINRPKVVDMQNIKPNKLNSAVTMIARLIMMKKGTIPDIPDLGIDIVGRYRFSYESELSALATDIQDQVLLYLPEFTPINVRCGMNATDSKQKRVDIHIIINESEYLLIYNTESNSIEGLENR